MPTAKNKRGGGGLTLLPHYPAVVAFVWEHRFATTDQVHRAFARTINSGRTARHQTQQLVRHRYLAAAPARTYDRSFPRVLVATKRGLRLVADRYLAVTGQTWSETDTLEDRRLARGRSVVHLEHELLLTDIDLMLQAMSERHPLVRWLKTERRYHQPERQLQFIDQRGRAESLEPDAGYFFLHQGHSGPWLDLCLLELDRANKLSAIGESLAQYEAWSASHAAAQYLADCCRRCGDTTTTRPTFRVLRVIGHRPGEGSDAQRLVAVLTRALATSPALQRCLWLTTYEAFIQQAGQDAPIWLRASDTRCWRAEYEHLTEQLARDGALTKRQRTARQRAFVGQKVGQMRWYSLFPPAEAPASAARAIARVRV